MGGAQKGMQTLWGWHKKSGIMQGLHDELQVWGMRDAVRAVAWAVGRLKICAFLADHAR